MGLITIAACSVFTLGVLAYALAKTRYLKDEAEIRSIGRPKDLKDFPTISVVIPARNEEKNIRTCLESLVKVDYPHLEIVVADDDSEDRTAEVVQDFRSRHPELSLQLLSHHRKDDLRRWASGKSRASYRGALRAKGEWILFADADTRHLQNSFWQMVLYAKKHDLDALSCGGRYLIPGWLTEAFEDIAYFATFVTMPIKAIRDPDSPINWVTGQFIFIKAKSYHRIGTHAAVREAYQDDVALGRRIKALRVPYRYFPNAQLFECLNYERVQDAITGWIRMIAAATPWLEMHRRAILLTTASIFFIGVFPVLIFIGASIGGNVLLMKLALGQIALICFSSFLNRSSMGLRSFGSLLAPVGSAIAVFVYARAYLMRFHSWSHRYRGRVFESDQVT